MTLFGVDVSHNNGSINWARVKAEGYSFAFVKFTESTSFVDPQRLANLAGARAQFGNRRVAAYHFQRPGSATAQAAHIKAYIPKDVAVVLDVETGSGDFGAAKAIAAMLKSAGYPSVGVYTGYSYWRSQGSPSLTWADYLWTAHYPDMVPGVGSVEYAGTPSSYWQTYGGMATKVLQFTPVDKVAGLELDGDAFKGTASEFEAMLYGAAKSAEVDDVSAKDVWDYKVKNLAHDPQVDSYMWQLVQYAHEHAASADATAKECLAQIKALADQVAKLK